MFSLLFETPILAIPSSLTNYGLKSEDIPRSIHVPAVDGMLSLFCLGDILETLLIQEGYYNEEGFDDFIGSIEVMSEDKEVSIPEAISTLEICLGADLPEKTQSQILETFRLSLA